MSKEPGADKTVHSEGGAEEQQLHEAEIGGDLSVSADEAAEVKGGYMSYYGAGLNNYSFWQNQ